MKKKPNNHSPTASTPPVTPAKLYPNSETSKAKILSDNQNTLNPWFITGFADAFPVVV